MNKRKLSWLAVAVALPALVFSALASTAFAEPGFDPARADELITYALIDESVLDGSGWTTTRNDFKESSLPDTTACKNSFAKLKAVEKGIEKDRAGRGKVTMEQTPADGEAPLSVEVEINVYKSAAPAASALKDLKTIYALDDMTKCATNQLETALSGVSGAKATPYIETTSSDPAAAYAAEFKASQIVSPYRLEHYTYVTGNTLTQITIGGPKPAVDKATVEFLVGLQVASVEILSGY